MDGDGRAYEAILRSRFPKEEDETDQEWRERAYAIAEAARLEPVGKPGKVIRSANNVGQK